MRQLGLNLFQLRKSSKEKRSGEGFYKYSRSTIRELLVAMHGPMDLINQRRGDFFAVLHQGTVDSPEKAVRAAIVNENHKGKEK